MEEKLTSFLLKISTNFFIASNVRGIISYASPKAGMLFNTPNILGLSLSGFLDNNSWNILNKRIGEVYQNHISSCLFLTLQERIYNVYLYYQDEQIIQCWEDITERHQLSSSLKRTAERLEFAERTTKLGYWELDLKARRLYWSTEMYKIFGLNARDVSHKNNIIRNHILPEDYPLYKEKVHSLITSGEPVDGMVRILRPDNQLVYCAFKASPISENGHRKIAGTFQDLTNLIEMQNDLETAKKAAEESNLAKSYFLAQASHDLRQPMQALKIFISTLEDEHLSSRQKSLVEKIGASADNLHSLLDNLLDISKLDSQGFERNDYGFDISELLKNIIFEFEEIAHHRKLIFHASLCHYTVYSNPLLIERVIRNLLSNAFKFCHHKVLLGCKREGDNIRILVIDNGPGITPNEQKVIFDEFYQSKKIKDNQKQGAGLGLSIVKRISDNLNLNIKVDSKVGKGSCFSFILPLMKNPRC